MQGSYILQEDHQRLAACSHLYSPDVVSGKALSTRRNNGLDRAVGASLAKPAEYGQYERATAVFTKLHTHMLVPAPKLTAREKRALEHRRLMEDEPPEEPPTTRDDYLPNADLTKFRALLADLAALWQAEPTMRAVIFTRHDKVQRRLVQLITDATAQGGVLAPAAGAPAAPRMRIFEFNASTPPTKRHRLIHDFQAAGEGARVFIVTYATAAVGITLTAASRVFLLEPTLDPAQELQAAGRIHRLGQTRDIFIKRFAFKDSIEEAVCALHDKIKSGEIVLTDGRFPREAHELFRQHGAANPHDFSGPTHTRTEDSDDSAAPRQLDVRCAGCHGHPLLPRPASRSHRPHSHVALLPFLTRRHHLLLLHRRLWVCAEGLTRRAHLQGAGVPAVRQVPRRAGLLSMVGQRQLRIPRGRHARPALPRQRPLAPSAWIRRWRGCGEHQQRERIPILGRWRRALESRVLVFAPPSQPRLQTYSYLTKLALHTLVLPPSAVPKISFV